MTIDDAELLRRFAKDGSPEAFEELVSRHSGLVYSAALRQVRSPELAQEVAQSVFVTLAQKAARLPGDVILSGWLYRATWFSATKVARTERRRQLREQESIPMNAHAHSPEEESVWKQIEPHLDDAMEKLGETDRTALVLRYLENKSLREVGSALGTNEDAAQKRVARALEKLRALFTRRKIGVSSTALAGAMSTFGVEAAPAMLNGAVVAAVTSAGVATVGGGFITTTLTNIMTITKAKIAVATGVAVVATQFAIHQNTTRELRDETEALRTANIQLQSREPGIVVDPDLVAEVATLRGEMARLREDAGELLTLRGVSTVLRRENDELKAKIKAGSGDDTPEPGADVLNNPMSRMELARELVKNGNYEKALEHLVWCFDEGAKNNPSFVGVRSSFLLNQLAELGKSYPPAKEALIQRRDAMEEKLRTGSGDRMLALDVVRLNGALDDTDRTVELFDEIPAGDPQRGVMVEVAYDELLNAKRYDAIFAAITPESFFGKRVQMFNSIRDNPQITNNEQAMASMLDSMIGAGGKAVETLAGAGQTQRAIGLIDQVLQQDSTIETVEDLKRHAQRAENTDVVRYLESFSGQAQ